MSGSAHRAWLGGARTFRLDFELNVGESALDYAAIAKTEKLADIDVQVRRLRDRVHSVRTEQAYFRSREMAMRNTNESTNRRVLGWSIFYVAFVLFGGFYQLRVLRNFFRARKIQPSSQRGW